MIDAIPDLAHCWLGQLFVVYFPVKGFLGLTQDCNIP